METKNGSLMQNGLLFLGLLLFNTICYGQELKLFRHNNTKVFKSGSIYEVVISESAKDKRCCSYKSLVGTLTETSTDSLHFKLSEFKSRYYVENVRFEENYQSKNHTINMTIASNEIYYLKNHKSYKSKSNKNGMLSIGAILIISSLGTLVNSVIVKNDASKNVLLISGGVQIGLGLSLVILGSSKHYYLKNKNDPWKIIKQ